MIITDWKTGKNEGNKLQASVYILFVMMHNKIPLDKIKAEFVYLGSMKTKFYGMNNRETENIKKFIISSAKEMLNYSF